MKIYLRMEIRRRKFGMGSPFTVQDCNYWYNIMSVLVFTGGAGRGVDKSGQSGEVDSTDTRTR